MAECNVGVTGLQHECRKASDRLTSYLTEAVGDCRFMSWLAALVSSCKQLPVLISRAGTVVLAGTSAEPLLLPEPLACK